MPRRSSRASRAQVACASSGASPQRLWGIELVREGGEENTPRNPGGAKPTCCDIRADGAEIVAGAANGKVFALDVASGSATELYATINGSVTCISYSPDSAFVASGDSQREVKVWSVRVKTQDFRVLEVP